MYQGSEGCVLIAVGWMRGFGLGLWQLYKASQEESQLRPQRLAPNYRELG